MDETFNKEQIINHWVNAYADDLYRWALSKVKRKELAEDFVQDTFFTAIQKIEQFEHQSSPKTWLFAILKNKVIDFYRKEARKKEVSNHDPLNFFFLEDENWNPQTSPVHWQHTDDSLLDNLEFGKVWRKCLGNLPPKWFAVIQLKFLENKNSQDVCKDLGITSSNYWQMIHRAKLQLRGCLERHWFSH